MIALNDRIIVKKLKLPEKTSGGIYVPDTAKEDSKIRLNVGKVISIGPGTRTVSGDYLSRFVGEVGDFIVWEQFGDLNAEILGKGMCAVRTEDLLCKVSREEVAEMGYADID
ncbi:MAG: co-chaperone GroES family protein [Candidatus Omnitrophota bacterium]|jgi:chaperonin GroES